MSIQLCALHQPVPVKGASTAVERAVECTVAYMTPAEPRAQTPTKSQLGTGRYAYGTLYSGPTELAHLPAL
jgi:hypothetical protein